MKKSSTLLVAICCTKIAFCFEAVFELGGGYGMALPSQHIGTEYTTGYNGFTWYTKDSREIYSSFGGGIKLHQGVALCASSNLGFVILLEESFLGRNSVERKDEEAGGTVETYYHHYTSNYMSFNTGIKIRQKAFGNAYVEVVAAPGILFYGSVRDDERGKFNGQIASSTHTYDLSSAFSLSSAISLGMPIRDAYRFLFGLKFFHSDPIQYFDKNKKSGKVYSLDNISANVGWCFIIRPVSKTGR